MKRLSRYILPTCIIMICMVIMAAAIRLIYGDYSQKQIEEQAQTQFASCCYQADSRLAEILAYGTQLSEMQPVLLSETDSKATNIKQDTLLFLLLNNLRSSTDLENTDIAFCYRSNPKMIYTPSGLITYTAYQEHLLELGVDADFSAVFSRLLTANTPALYSTVPSDRIMFFLPIGNVWTTYQSSLLLVMEKSFMTFFFAGQPGQVYGINNYGTILFGSDETAGKTYTLANLYPYTGKSLGHAVVDGEKLVLLNHRSSTGLLTYTTVIPEREFYASWHELNMRLMIIVFSVLLLLLIAISLTIYFSNRSWKHVYKTVIGTAPTGWTNEDMRTLLHSVEKKQESITALNERLESSLGTIYRQLVLDLINSHIKDPKELDSYKELLGAPLDRPWWIALYLPKPVSSEAEDFTDQALVALDDFYYPGSEVLFTECSWEKGIGIVVNFSSGSPHDDVEAMSKALYAHLSTHLAVPFSLFAGSCENSPLQIGTSFYRATAAAKEQENSGKMQLFFWQKQERASPFSLDTTLLSEAVTFGNAEVALSAFDELLQRLRSSDEHYSVIHVMACDVISAIVRAGQRQGVTADTQNVRAAAEASSLQTFETTCKELIESICVSTNERRSADASMEHSRIITFITQNYKRNDFSLNMLSEEMDMSISKINMLLKEKLGCSFVQYVSLLRVNEVKRLLRETDDPIQSIVEGVGYIDMSSFIRKFKKMEGISPGQYRALHRQ